MPDSVTAMMAGMAMGFVGSIPLTGPIALLVFHRALQARFARGMAVGVGGAIGESIYCALAVAGVGALVEQLPLASAGLKFLSAMVLVAFGVYFLAVPPTTVEDEELPDTASETWYKDLAQGFTISAFNPVLLLNWTAAIVIVRPLVGVDFTSRGSAFFVVGATVGVALWFSMMVLILRYFRRQIPERTISWIQRGMGAIVLAAAALPFHDILTSLDDIFAAF